MASRGSRLGLLLTATIQPADTVLTKRTDPLARTTDYRVALATWLRMTDLPIIFAENSRSSLDTLRQSVRDAGRIEWLSVDPDPATTTRGKGFGEASILRQVLDRSLVATELSHVVKVTGRLSVRNAPAILSGLSHSQFDVAAEMRLGAFEWSDSRMFAATPEFLRGYLLPEAEHIDDHVGANGTMESALARSVLRRVADRGRWIPLPRYPLFTGRSGTLDVRITNRRYPFHLMARWARRQALRAAV